jgi:CheY-like chemotaxis protein
VSDASILIVEDEAVVAADLAQKLRRLGYKIAGLATRGADAVGLARERHPDLVLMDIRLDGPMDGVQAAELIWQDMDVPVVFLTAHVERSTAAQSGRPVAYVLKPFDSRELEVCIRRVLCEGPRPTSPAPPPEDRS